MSEEIRPAPADPAIAAHIADTTDAHDASAVSVTPAGNITSTDVQAALVELDGDIAAGGIPSTIFDAVGDLIVADAADSADRLPVGADGEVLTADSGEALGVKWAAGGTAPVFVGCMAVRTTNQTGVVTSTETLVSFTGTDESDTDGFHDPAGANPSRITIPAGKAGKYAFSAAILWDSNTTGQRRIGLLKNGTTYFGLQGLGSSAGGVDTNYNALTMQPVDMAVGDYMEVTCWQNSGTNRTLTGSVIALRFGATLTAYAAFVSAFRGALAYNDGAQVIGTSSVTALTFAAESYDTDTLHDTSSNTSRVTIPSGMDGKWRFAFHTTLRSGNNTTGIRAIWLRKNGTTDIIGSELLFQPLLNQQFSGTVTVDCALVATDYVEVVVFQSSGGNLSFGDTLVNGPGHVNSLSAQFLGA